MSADQPNIILFTTDQHRGDYIGLADHPLIETPNLDAWVNNGAYFPNAYTEIPSTTGARRILHSGKTSYHCGLIGYAGVEWHEENTLPAVLGRAGYHCFSVGFRNMHPRRKLYGYHQAVPHDLRKGDDDYMDWLESQVGPEVFERGHGSDANGWIGRAWHLEERLHSTVWTTDVALDLVAKSDPTKPFFLWVSHLRPHSPYDPPQYYWDMYNDADIPEPVIGDWCERYRRPDPKPDRTAWCGELTPEQTHRCRAGYMGNITHIDYEMGRMQEMLNRIGRDVAANTVWLMVSDHGDMMGDHYLHRKSYAFEGSARVPFVIKYPRGYDGPTGTFDQPVGKQDVMPTLLDFAGVDGPEGMTGDSVLKATRGEEWREWIHGEHSHCYHDLNAMQYATNGKEKYIWYPRTGEEQFFDLTENRDELHNAAADADKQDRVAMWRQRMIEFLGKRPDGFSDGEKLLFREDLYDARIEANPGYEG